jgi:multidrug efflux pump subunit AcrB
MIESSIRFFAKRHLLANIIFLGVIIAGVFAWRTTQKEELPSITFDFVRVSVRYPGAPAEDVEYYVTKPLEEKIRGIDGVYRIDSTASVGQGSVRAELEQGLKNVDEVVAEVRNAVLDTRMPDEVIDDPSIRVFKTDKKAILDIGIFKLGSVVLSIDERQELQRYAFALENRLLALPEVNSVDRRGYLQEEVQIKVRPKDLLKYDIPFNSVQNQIRSNHIRQPAGTIESGKEPKVTLLSELDTPQKLGDLAVQGGFEGRVIRLREVADIRAGYEKPSQLLKINGHEGIMFSVVKAGQTGILDARQSVLKTIEGFESTTLKGSPIRLQLLDDESIDVRNRINLISQNGAIGFVLILIMLFAFLDRRSGIWVAMGIPFTLCFTMVGASLLGYTINGTTLAAVIIVMGIIVDDAIVVAENITREVRKGVERSIAVVQATSYVMLPIVAAITTTCVAFVPLFFFSGHFGKFVTFIPPIIFLVLAASLFESIYLLPGHMALDVPGGKDRPDSLTKTHWFDRFEVLYGKALERWMPWRWAFFALSIGLLGFCWWTGTTKMKFVMFPNEETRDIVLTGFAPKGFTREQTAAKVREVERIFDPYMGGEVVGTRTNIGSSRRGGAAMQNNFRMLIEIVPKDEREKSADALVKEFEKELAKLKGFTKLRFRKSRWGSESGSPITILVQNNNDEQRARMSRDLAKALENHPEIANPEVDEGHFTEEYRVRIDREKVKRLSIAPGDVAKTFRAALEGTVLYDFSNGDEDIRVRLTTADEAKDHIDKVLAIPVENQRNYLVPLRDLVSVEKVRSPTAISRKEMKRTTMVDADIREGSEFTPLDAAAFLETGVFPDILSRFPAGNFLFEGEIKNTRESRNDFRNAALLAILLIYGILAILFDSTTKPLIIMLSIPFGVVGVVMAFWAHGKVMFGFYAAVGVLGLAGVVINDSIVMLVKLIDGVDPDAPAETYDRQVAQVSQTRLRAVILTTLTTVAGVLPTAYGWMGYDAMLAEMMLSLAWGLVFGTVITLILIPSLFRVGLDWTARRRRKELVRQEIAKA